MGSGIILCGGNGAGKSTLGEALARKLGWTFLDIETYYFPNREADYTYAAPRTQEEATKLLLEDMRRHEKFVFAAVKGNYGEEVVSMLTGAVLLSVPKAIRMKRVKDRSYQKFGDRILPGGDLHRQEERFLPWWKTVRSRTWSSGWSRFLFLFSGWMERRVLTVAFVIFVPVWHDLAKNKEGYLCR